MFNVTSLSFNHSILQPLYTLQFEARAMMHCAHRPHALDRNTGISIMGLYNKMAAPLFRIHSMQTSYRILGTNLCLHFSFSDVWRWRLTLEKQARGG